MRKAVVIAIIAVLVIGVWALKKQNSANNELVTTVETDFSLHVLSKIDMDKLKSYNVPIMTDFGAGECIPCKEMAPVLVQLNQELEGKAIIKFVDVWKNAGLATGYPVSIIPTQIFINSSGQPYIPDGTEGIEFILYNDKSGNHVFTAHQGGLTKPQIIFILEKMGL